MPDTPTPKSLRDTLRGVFHDLGDGRGNLLGIYEGSGSPPCWGDYAQYFAENYATGSPGDEVVTARSKVWTGFFGLKDPRPLLLLIDRAVDEKDPWPALLDQIFHDAPHLSVTLQRGLAALDAARAFFKSHQSILDELHPEAVQILNADDVTRLDELVIFRARVGKLRSYRTQK